MVILPPSKASPLISKRVRSSVCAVRTERARPPPSRCCQPYTQHRRRCVHWRSFHLERADGCQTSHWHCAAGTRSLRGLDRARESHLLGADVRLERQVPQQPLLRERLSLFWWRKDLIEGHFSTARLIINFIFILDLQVEIPMKSIANYAALCN